MAEKQRFEVPQKIESFFSVLASICKSEGDDLLLSVIVNATVQVIEHWTDDWGGHVVGHALKLTIPEALYVKILKTKDKILHILKEHLNQINSVHNEYISNIFIDFIGESLANDWRQSSGALLPGGRIIDENIQSRIWDKDHFRLFLSHKSEVKKETAALKNALNSFNISCFVAHEDIEPTQEWQNEIENALFSMDALVALITDGFRNSKWTDQEVGVAMGRGVPIVSVSLETVDPYGFIGKFQALKCSWSEAPLEIAKLLILHEKMKDVYIKALHQCDSFNLGNRLAGLLPHINTLSDAQVDSIIDAYKNNNEIAGSWGFNGSYFRQPSPYGNGLAYHLKRISGKEHILD